MKSVWRWSLMACCSVLLTSPSAAQDTRDADAMSDLQIIKARTVELLAGGTGSGSYRTQALTARDERVERILTAPFQRLAWPEPEGEQDFNQHLDRLLGQTRALAEGWASDGSRHHGDERLLRRALEGLDNVLEHYNADTPRPGNWYYWLIAIPDKLGAIGLLLGEQLPAPLRELLEVSLTHQLRTMELSGANAAWEARNHAYLALLQEDPVRLARAARRVFETVRYSSDGGVREDYSYLFHGHIPYAGAYGSGFAETVAQFMYLFDNTAWSASLARRQLLVRLLLEHFRWVIVGGNWDPIVSGRVYDSLRRADGALTAMLFMTQVQHDAPQRLRGAAAALLADGGVVDAGVATFADALQSVPPEPPRGFRYWYTADLGAWADARYHVSFRQYSRRVQDYEYLNRQGARGWNLAYGFTHISRSGREWFDGPRAAQPVADMDWDHLPGTTSRVGAHPHNDDADPSSYGHSLNYGRSQYSGGAGLGEGGMAAFVLLPTYGDFSAHKSLSFFPGGFLSVGSEITAAAGVDSTRPVHTTLLQWVAPTAQEQLLVDGVAVLPGQAATHLPQVRWCFIDSVGLALPVPTDLWVARSGRVTTIWLDHGTTPKGAGYAYAVLPASTIEETADFAAAPPVRVVHQDGLAHVVVDTLRGTISAAFFAAGAAAGIRARAPIILHLQQDGASGAIAVQDPLHDSRPLDVALPVSPAHAVHAVDEGLQARVLDDRLQLHIAAQLGRIYRAAWGPGANQLPAARRVDLADFYAFEAAVEADAERAVFTVHLAEEPLREGYELHLQGRKGHLIHVFDDADVLDRPAAGVVRYLWRHGQHESGADDRMQREGDFRLLLYTELKMATAYITLPHFDSNGHPSPSDLPPDANRRP
jgi:hyaluronate lyase